MDAADVAQLRLRHSYKWRTFPPDVLPAHVAEHDLPTAPAIRSALRELVERGDFGYAVAGDLPETYVDFARWRYGQDIDPADVHLIGDVMQGVYAALRLLVAPGGGVVICPPVYHPFFPVVAAAGARVVEVPLTGPHYDLDLAGLEAAFAAGARALLLCHPHNPVGRVWSAADLEAVAALAERYGVTVLSDEIHAPLVYDGQPFPPYVTESSISFVSASKAWNVAGLKTALAVTHSPAMRARWATLPDLVHIAASNAGVRATCAAFGDGRDWLDEAVAHLQANRDHLRARLAAELPAAGTTPIQATYLAWLDLRAYDLGDDPAATILERSRLALDSGPRFGTSGTGFARLNFGTGRAVLDEVVDRLARALS